MRVARKLTLALVLSIFCVLVINAYTRLRRELLLYEADAQRDHQLLARGLGAAIVEVWVEEGEARALRLVERANERESSVLIRWVWFDGGDRAHEPAAPTDQLAPVRAGERVVWVDRTPPGRLYTYVPLSVPTGRRGALEISETLEAARTYQALAATRIVLTTGALLVIGATVAFGLGSWLVGRPVERLIDKARRVGAGDFSSPLDLEQDDELGELAREMNVMAERLAAAERRIAAEGQARLEAMEQLRHADRLRTVGQLASGIAHELGTPLNVVGARAKMIAGGEVSGDAVAENARIIGEQTERMARIIRQLLDFARPRPPRKEPEDVWLVAERTVQLLSPIARKRRVDVRLAAHDGAERLRIDAAQIQQVLTNLLVNAIDAMPDGGTVEIDVRREPRRSPIGDTTPRMHVGIVVADDGPGMTEEVRRRLFEPFFTTKPVGEGTGLGLAVSWGIVVEHGGHVEVAAEPGRGSRFVVWLPVEEA